MANDKGSDPKGPCQICQKIGHITIEYWHRFKKNYVPQPNNRRETRGAYVAAVDGQSSGATNHVTNALRNINIHYEYQGNEKLVITNGKSS